MIDLSTIAPAPMGITTEYAFASRTETECRDGWVGASVQQDRPHRLHRLRWLMAHGAATEAFKDTLRQTVGGNLQVVFSPPNDPASGRVAQIETIVGRLVQPFTIRNRSSVDVEITATLREDF